ncbi:MAG: c-type cytochrome [Planctomycetes bacterium]|nr:c-type cytochrome [Planctomycetota bacterium]
MRDRSSLVLASLGVALTLVLPVQKRASGQGSDDRLVSSPQSPDDALRSFELHPEFRIELVASEPLIQDPVAMAFDERGDLYVVEYPEFNEYQFAPGVGRSGCVKRLQDTDGDGRYDVATVFAEVPFATALICYEDGVFVGAPPDVLFCKDTDGDGVADEKRAVLTGFGRDFAGGGLLNSFRWGFDNRIHIATGFAGAQVRRPDQEKDEPVDIRSRGLILDPRTLEFEPTSGGGQHGMGMDDWGNKFLCSNVNPLQMLTYDDRYAARNSYFAPPSPARNINGEGPLVSLRRVSPLEPWRVARSQLAAGNQEQDNEATRAGGVFTSASGITVYRGDAFPSEFYGNLFVGEVANNLVYRAQLESSGVAQVAMRADDDAEFLASRDNWFRPVQFANGPDGALYVVDMYRQLIEGAAFVPKEPLAKLDPSRGIDRGRIYRVVPKSFKRREAPRLGKLTALDLVALLEHSNGWHRETAARLLYQRQDPQAAIPLKQLAVNSKIPQARMLALYALETQESLDSQTLQSALGDPHARVREHAVRLAESKVQSSPVLREALFAKVTDPDVGVRYQLAFTLGSVRDPRRNALLVDLVRRDVASRDMLFAVQSSLATGGGEVFARLAVEPELIAKEPIRKLLLDLAAQIGLRSDTSEVAAVLKSVSALAIRDHELVEAIQQKLFAGMRRQRFGKFEAGSANSIFNELMRSARELAVDEPKPIARRVQAASTLGLADFNDPTIQAIFQRLLDPNQPRPIQLVACETLARFDHPRVAELLLNAWPSMTPALRGTCVETLLSRTGWIVRFLDAVETGSISRNDVDPARMRLVTAHVDEAMQSRMQLLFPPSRRNGRQSVVDSYRVALELVGDAERGQGIFRRVCASCHLRKGIGKTVGADLKDTARRPPESLLIDILDPMRQLKPHFQNYVIRTKDGRVLTGLIVEETANGIRIQQADGGVQEILQIQIDFLQGTGVSFMPEGLEKTISQQAMADLLTFLSS